MAVDGNPDGIGVCVRIADDIWMSGTMRSKCDPSAFPDFQVAFELGGPGIVRTDEGVQVAPGQRVLIDFDVS